MAYNAQGTWEPEDDSVATRVTGLLAQNNPLMTQARESAKSFSNKRGLLNSSIAAGAGEQAAIGAALPIASQDAQQTAQKNLTSMGIKSQENIAGMNVAAHDRQYAQAALSDLQKKYAASLAEVIKNNDIPADARNKYYAHFSALRDQDMALLESMYGIDLTWDTAVVTV